MVAVTTLLCGATGLGVAQPVADPAIAPVLAKLGAYVASYGEKVSLMVGVEKYTQSVMFDSAASPAQPRRLVAEFAIVKTSDHSGWVGFRDVVEVDGKALRDRRDRLLSLFTNTTSDTSEAARIANESARFNVGPISRNFNTPTSALFFFLPEHHGRFRFTRKGTKKIDGVTTWELAFKETRSPTFVMTRAGKDVPLEGALWVDPAAGTVLRTRLHMRNFADTITNPVQQAPNIRAPANPAMPQGGVPIDTPAMYIRPIESEADIEVTYKLQPDMGVWLPATMEELYVGPIAITVTPSVGRATTRSTYSDFRQFGASARVVPQ